MSNDVVVEIVGENSELQSALSEAAGLVDEFSSALEGAIGNIGGGGDGLDGLVSGFNAAEDASEEFSDETKEGLKETKSAVMSLTQAVAVGLASAFGTALMGAATAGLQAVVNGIGKVINVLPQSIQLANEQIEAETRLASVLRSTGNAAGFTLDQMKKLASQMQTQTRIGDEVMLNTMSVIATFKNVRGDHFKEAAMLAADMATVLQQDLRSSALQISKALQDPERGLTALTRAGVQFTEQQKEQVRSMLETNDVMGAQRVILNELSSQFGGAAADQADTFAGRVEQLQNRLGDVGEVIGMMLIPVLDELLPLADNLLVFLENAVPKVQPLVEMFKEWALEMGERLKPAFLELVDTSLWVFAALETSVLNFNETWEAVLMSAGLLSLSLIEEWKHLFNVKAPAIFKWLTDVTYDYFKNMASNWVEMQKNILQNLIEFMAGVSDLIQGGEADFKFVALTKGFETAVREFPEIAQRELTKAELMAAELVTSAWDDVNDKVEDRYKRNRAILDEIMAGGSGIEVGDDTASDIFDAGKAKKDAKEEAKKDKEKKKDSDESVSGFEELEALGKRIQAAAASDQDPVEKAVVDIGDNIVDGLKDVVKAIPEIGKQFNEGLEAFLGPAMNTTNWLGVADTQQERDQKLAEGIEKAAGYLGGIFDLTKKNKDEPARLGS